MGLSLSLGAAAQVPRGTSPYIFGMHDHPELSVFKPDASCARGWITELRYIGASGRCDGVDLDFHSLADQGFGIILRLDYSGAPSLPPYEHEWNRFAETVADCVRRARDVRVWVIGNEPNLPWGHPENRSFRPEEYGEIYRRVVAAVDNTPQGHSHEILFAGMGIWAAIQPWGDWDDGMARAMAYVLEQGGRIDGLAVHAYTRNDFRPEAIVSDQWFPGRENKWRMHFRSYRDALEVLAAQQVFDIPIYITESGNACDPPCQPYRNENRGYFQAMYREIDEWNNRQPQQLIRAVTPYRWSGNDDGSGRDFCIGCRENLKADLRAAVATGARWEGSDCERLPDDVHPPSSGLDASVESTDAEADAGINETWTPVLDGVNVHEVPNALADQSDVRGSCYCSHTQSSAHFVGFQNVLVCSVLLGLLLIARGRLSGAQRRRRTQSRA